MSKLKSKLLGVGLCGAIAYYYGMLQKEKKPSTFTIDFNKDRKTEEQYISMANKVNSPYIIRKLDEIHPFPEVEEFNRKRTRGPEMHLPWEYHHSFHWEFTLARIEMDIQKNKVKNTENFMPEKTKNEENKLRECQIAVGKNIERLLR